MPEEIERLHYYQLQFLGAEDFQAEQAYHRDMRRRHNLAHHTWGIVTGLALEEEASGSGFDVYLTPGLAIDGFGREIVVGARQKLDTADLQFFNKGTASHDVFIAFVEEQAQPPAFGYASCEGDAQTDRVRESFRIVIAPKPLFKTPVVVDGTALANPPADGSVPYQEFPDTAATRWLVRLGSVLWDGDAKVFLEATTPAGSLLTTGRTYAGVVADRLLTPDKTLRIRQRAQPATIDPDFVTVEGGLTVQGDLRAEANVIAEKDVAVHGKLAFEVSGPADGKIFLQRTGKDLRVTIEDSLVIGKTGSTSLAVREKAVEIPTGTLRIANKQKQMVLLSAASDFSVGVDGSALTFRGNDAFSWYAGTQTPDGKLQMTLDSAGQLELPAPTGQLVNLSTTAGIGVQHKDTPPGDALYFRSAQHFAFYRKGGHNDDPLNPGGGGTMVLHIAGDNTVTIPGALTAGGLTSNGPLTTNGPLTANGPLTVGGPLSVSGPFTATSAQMQSLTVNGNATIAGDLVLTPGHGIAVGSGFRAPLDVVTGVETFATPVTLPNDQRKFKVKSNLLIASSATMHVTLAAGEVTTLNGSWLVALKSVQKVSPTQNEFEFTITTSVLGAVLRAVSWVAFFTP